MCSSKALHVQDEFVQTSQQVATLYTQGFTVTGAQPLQKPGLAEFPGGQVPSLVSELASAVQFPGPGGQVPL